MHRFALLALCAAFAFAQPNDPFKPKPPADVDAALRARVQEFFDLHVKGQFRKAEELGAEDTKDYFYTHNKPKYIACEFSRVDYSENFTKANALVLCEQYIMVPGFADHPMKVPTPSTWKLENGKWYWYVDGDAIRMTPAGKMTAGPFPAAGVPAPPAPGSVPITADFVFKQIQLVKERGRLKIGESAEVAISNSAPGPMAVLLPKALPRLEAKLDKSIIPAGGQTVPTLDAAKGAKSGGLNAHGRPRRQV